MVDLSEDEWVEFETRCWSYLEEKLRRKFDSKEHCGTFEIRPSGRAAFFHPASPWFRHEVIRSEFRKGTIYSHDTWDQNFPKNILPGSKAMLILDSNGIPFCPLLQTLIATPSNDRLDKLFQYVAHSPNYLFDECYHSKKEEFGGTKEFRWLEARLHKQILKNMRSNKGGQHVASHLLFEMGVKFPPNSCFPIVRKFLLELDFYGLIPLMGGDKYYWDLAFSEIQKILNSPFPLKSLKDKDAFKKRSYFFMQCKKYFGIFR